MSRSDRQRLNALRDALVSDILNMTDEEIMAELREDHSANECHTPGPWFWAAGCLHNGKDGWGEMVLEPLISQEGGASIGVNEANARLIKAAPELLAALPDLSHVISWLENGCTPATAANELRLYQAKIDRARAKAEGR